MNKVLFIFIFLGTFQSMARHGFGRTFAYWLLPVVMLVNFADGVAVPGLPNLTSGNMVVYGVIAGLPFCWHELRKIRWNLLDTAALLVLIPIFVTKSFVTLDNVADLKLGQRESMEAFCRWLVPYFMARIALQDADGRRAALRSLCVMTVVIGCITAVESTFRPNETARMLAKLKWNNVPSVQVLGRWGLSRAISTAGQPIDLGCMGVLAGTMILVLIPATGTDWKRPLPVAGILGAGAMVFGCVSLTAWGAMVVAFVAFFLFTRPGIGKYLVIPFMLAELGGMVYVSERMLNETIVDERPDDPIEASRWIRVRIMQDSWAWVSTSGWFGHGPGLDVKTIGVSSVDNSYLLFIMGTGWVSLLLWLAMLFVMASKATMALSRVATASERVPVAAATAGLLAMVYAMYTVFFGFAYAVLFHVVLGMLGTMCQLMALPRAASVTMQGGATPHGFPMIAGTAR